MGICCSQKRILSEVGVDGSAADRLLSWAPRGLCTVRARCTGVGVYINPSVSNLTGSVCARTLNHEYDPFVVVPFLILPLVAYHRYRNT